MTAQLSPRPPSILDDVYEPAGSTRRNRLPAVIAGALLAIVCVTFVTVRAGTFDRNSSPAQVSRDLWYPDSTDRLGWRSQLSPVAAPEVPAVRPAPSAARARVRPAPAPPPPAARAPVRSTPVPNGRATVVPGYLAVNSTPWAALSVDGRVVGNTPQPRISLPPGRHQLVFARDGFAAETTWVIVAPGATVKLTGIRLTPVEP